MAVTLNYFSGDIRTQIVKLVFWSCARYYCSVLGMKSELSDIGSKFISNLLNLYETLMIKTLLEQKERKNTYTHNIEQKQAYYETHNIQ